MKKVVGRIISVLVLGLALVILVPCANVQVVESEVKTEKPIASVTGMQIPGNSIQPKSNTFSIKATTRRPSNKIEVVHWGCGTDNGGCDVVTIKRPQ